MAPTSRCFWVSTSSALFISFASGCIKGAVRFGSLSVYLCILLVQVHLVLIFVFVIPCKLKVSDGSILERSRIPTKNVSKFLERDLSRVGRGFV